MEKGVFLQGSCSAPHGMFADQDVAAQNPASVVARCFYKQ